MALSIEGVRPSLLGKDQLEPFHELHGFRHVFRAIYDSTLDPRKLAIAADHVEPAVATLREIRNGLAAE